MSLERDWDSALAQAKIKQSDFGKKSSSERISEDHYISELRRLQGKLVDMLEWIKENKKKVVVIFEGRDGAGKGGAIKRVTEYLSPRFCRVVALPAPTELEKTQWYFQRYVAHLPSGGELVVFDRSWYNRAGVEYVMGFCTKGEYEEFLNTAPEFERMLIRSGIQIVKYWFSVSDAVQEKRFQKRLNQPYKSWKLSPMDLESRQKWVEYSRAKDTMLARTSIPEAPWYVVDGDVKKHARLNCIAHLLSMVEYKKGPKDKLLLQKRPPGPPYQRPPFESQNVIPKVYP